MLNEVTQALNSYEVYVDGERYLGTANVELPELNFMTTEIKGAGVAGTIEFPIIGHLESFELKLSWRTLFRRPIYLMRQQSHNLSLRGAMQHYDAASGNIKFIPVRIDARCRVKGTNLGKLEPGEQTETETTFSCDYIKITENDKNTVLEFDIFNYVFSADGVDYMADVRDALGL